MTIFFGIIATFGALYALAIWQMADALDAEEERQRLEYIESVGGENSPLLNPELCTSPYVTPEYFTSKYSTWDQNFYDAIPNMVEVRPRSQMSAPGPAAVPEPVPMSQGLNHVEPRGSAVQVQNSEPVQPAVQVQGSEGSEQWLNDNRVYFPLEVPPDLINSNAGLRALEDAELWIKKAIKAGVSQTKIATEMFGTKKGGNKAYLRIVNLVKEVRSK